ncbi:uncharacterized protein LOC113389810 [Ctenocephalides felis]|uniref:uncharacterized protein LOC113389809 n=1 Tax=Ctenocephalides felis TaxID=7515 RepID=UPI000E6E20A4|nr:uncharacterized protein LOC113389809 [Ctenocephalides felis]XP_026482602.1 uncharacterized protein LOC113389810 [Ctenocephalides felis]
MSRSAPVKSWINFEDIPEKRRPPKRIQTIPTAVNIPSQHRSAATSPPNVSGTNQCSAGHGAGGSLTPQGSSSMVRSYVDPEDCRCECHDSTRHAGPSHAADRSPSAAADEEDRKPLLQLDSGAISDSSPELSSSHDRPLVVLPGLHQHHSPSEYSTQHLTPSGQRSLSGPFAMDLDLGTPSNRSSIVSQVRDELDS